VTPSLRNLRIEQGTWQKLVVYVEHRAASTILLSPPLAGLCYGLRRYRRLPLAVRANMNRAITRQVRLAERLFPGEDWASMGFGWPYDAYEPRIAFCKHRIALLERKIKALRASR
jgi:hypothetical protein